MRCRKSLPHQGFQLAAHVAQGVHFPGTLPPMTLRSALLLVVAFFAAGVWANVQAPAVLAAAAEKEPAPKEEKLCAPPAGVRTAPHAVAPSKLTSPAPRAP